MASEIFCKTLTTHEDFARVFELELEIWGMSPGSTVTVSVRIMQAIAHNGGVVIGAETEGKLIGFTLGLPGRRGDQWLLWSQMTGVSAAYQGHGIGFELKQAQRRWALDHDYPVIGWTFDPMQRGNANFNLRHLGVIVKTYLINVYGEMIDGINAGLPSDRVEATWRLQDARVAALSEGHALPPLTTHYPEQSFLLRMEGDRFTTQPVDPGAEWCFAEIPYDLKSLKESDIDQARAWQLALREVMLSALEAGYTVVDFVVQGDRCWYALRKDR